jgi:hypothetical protein
MAILGMTSSVILYNTPLTRFPSAYNVQKLVDLLTDGLEHGFAKRPAYSEIDVDKPSLIWIASDAHDGAAASPTKQDEQQPESKRGDQADPASKFTAALLEELIEKDAARRRAAGDEIKDGGQYGAAPTRRHGAFWRFFRQIKTHSMTLFESAVVGQERQASTLREARLDKGLLNKISQVAVPKRIGELELTGYVLAELVRNWSDSVNAYADVQTDMHNKNKQDLIVSLDAFLQRAVDDETQRARARYDDLMLRNAVLPMSKQQLEKTHERAVVDAIGPQTHSTLLSKSVLQHAAGIHSHYVERNEDMIRTGLSDLTNRLMREGTDKIEEFTKRCSSRGIPRFGDGEIYGTFLRDIEADFNGTVAKARLLAADPESVSVALRQISASLSRDLVNQVVSRAAQHAAKKAAEKCAMDVLHAEVDAAGKTNKNAYQVEGAQVAYARCGSDGMALWKGEMRRLVKGLDEQVVGQAFEQAQAAAQAQMDTLVADMLDMQQRGQRVMRQHQQCLHKIALPVDADVLEQAMRGCSAQAHRMCRSRKDKRTRCSIRSQSLTADLDKMRQDNVRRSEEGCHVASRDQLVLAERQAVSWWSEDAAGRWMRAGAAWPGPNACHVHMFACRAAVCGFNVHHGCMHILVHVQGAMAQKRWHVHICVTACATICADYHSIRCLYSLMCVRLASMRYPVPYPLPSAPHVDKIRAHKSECLHSHEDPARERAVVPSSLHKQLSAATRCRQASTTSAYAPARARHKDKDTHDMMSVPHTRAASIIAFVTLEETACAISDCCKHAGRRWRQDGALER